MAPKKGSTKTKAPTKPVQLTGSQTVEDFDTELKSLAAKAQDDTTIKYVLEQAKVYVNVIVLLGLVAIYSNVSAQTLSPTYGSIPVSIWHNKLVLAALFVGWSSNLYLARLMPVKLATLLPVVAIYIPMIQFFLGRTSSTLTAHHGPLINEGLTLFPLIVLSAACTATKLEQAEFTALPSWLMDAAPGILSYGIFKGAETVAQNWLMHNTGKSLILTRLGLEMVLGVAYSLLAPSKLLLLTLPALLHTAFYNTHSPLPYTTKSLEAYMESNKWVLIDRKESLTGYISVIDSVEQGFRVMRCDHSLLGGEWTNFKGGRVAEPIYGVFTMLEAVRLVETSETIVDSEAKALVIGLGIGTLPAALVAHGIDTTVVEIDPVVSDFAAKYFRLPSNHTSITADAVSYTAGLVEKKSAQFDYIVHDVFTGGAEPIDLFTLEFLQGLNTLLKPNGVIAINYAGDFAYPSPKIIVQTIKEVFPSCRIFRETQKSQEAIAKEGRDFTNMVIFCTKRPSPLSFRKLTPADTLGSRTRNAFLPPKYEVHDADFMSEAVGILRKNETASVVKWHEMSALGHWALMRTVLPDFVWENW